MLNRFVAWLTRRAREITPERLEAQRDAQQAADEIRTARVEERQVTRATGR
jgi:hypothetical protein